MKKILLSLGIAVLFISCDSVPPSSDHYIEEYDPIFNTGENYDPKTESIILHYNKEVIPVVSQKLSDDEYEEESSSFHWFDFNPVKQTDNFFEEFLN